MSLVLNFICVIRQIWNLTSEKKDKQFTKMFAPLKMVSTVRIFMRNQNILQNDFRRTYDVE